MPLTILVVEDEATNMHILCVGLEALGHDVVQAWDPLDGIALARTCAPDVILMDLMFKGASIDGVEAIRRLKSDPATCAIPIVAQTAAVLEFAEIAVKGAGADGFLQKPFRRRQLVATIEAAIAGLPPGQWPEASITVPAEPRASMCIRHIPSHQE